ncbi:MAG: ABC transporter substrate-binding protein [Candidatus Bipolaricaulia bacterium]
MITNVRNMLFTMMVLMFAIGLIGSAASFPVAVIDDQGQRVTIEVRPRRIVAVTELAVHTLIDIGAGNRLVGVLTSSDLPPEVRNVPKVGPSHNLSVERIIARDPDLVLGAVGAVRNQLNQLGVNTYTFRPIIRVEDNMEFIRIYGQITGNVAETNEIVADIQNALDEVQAWVEDKPKVPAAFIHVRGEAVFVSGGRTPEHDLLTKAGGQNVFSHISGNVRLRRPEELGNPQIIFTDPAYVSKILNMEGFQFIDAVRNRQVFAIPADEVTGSQVGRVLTDIANRIHPPLFF